jgi:ketosteroid isomerase-like protein
LGTAALFEANWAQIFSFREGMVSRHREYSDTAAWEIGFGA